MKKSKKELNHQVALEKSFSEEIKLHEADLKLIRLIRSINSGEIENIKVQNGLPVSYKTAWKSGELN